MEIHLFETRVLASLVQFLDANGDGSERFLNRVRIPRESVDFGGWASKRQVYDLALDVTRRLGTPEAVFCAYSTFQIDFLGPITVAMSSCKTVKEALETAARMAMTVFDGSEYFLEIDGATAWFCYRDSVVGSEGKTFINDMTLGVYCQMIRDLADENWRPTLLRTHGEVLDRHRPVDAFSECKSIYHPKSTGLAFPAEFLWRPIPKRVREAGIKSASAWQFGLEESEPIVEKLSRLLTSQFPTGKLPTLDMLGNLVSVSPRTLKRHLALAGTSYTGLLDRIRFDSACAMLTASEMTIRSIACELGYSGTNNFVRSFKRMTGISPGEYRTRHILAAN